jgi:hypothetical protein
MQWTPIMKGASFCFNCYVTPVLEPWKTETPSAQKETILSAIAFSVSLPWHDMQETMASFTALAPLPSTKRNKPSRIETLEKPMHRYMWTLNQLSWSTVVTSSAEMAKYLVWEMTFFV